MSRHLHIDYETFSSADLKSVGAWRYAFDPSSEILCCAFALEGEKPVVWHANSHPQESFDKYWDALEDPDVLLYAHNAGFEMAITAALMQKTWNIAPPDLSRWRCTASFARRAALPAKLETLAITLGLTNLKDKRGASLIRKFSIMQLAKKPTKKNPAGLPPTRIRPEDDPAAFAEFLEYCRQDVVVEMEVAKRLAYFDEPINNSTYSLDAVINARGVPVNLDALRHAQKIVDEETEIVSGKFRELTGFEITQNAVFLKWLHGQGVHLDNLQAETVENFLESVPSDWPVTPAVQALQMKQSVAYASIKKIPTMLACAGPHDNRIRGMLNHHGATTGRWTASLVQFQNMKRSTIKNSDAAYRDICAGISREMLELTYGPPLEVIGSCIRHFVHDAQPCPECGGVVDFSHPVNAFIQACVCGKKGIIERPFLNADFAAVEARIVNWLAGQEDALEEYRQGVDRYKVMASVIYGIPADEVNKFPQRFMGKAAVLGCGFGMGAPKFRGTFDKQGGYDMPVGLEDVAVKAFRSKHNKVVKFWTLLDNAAKSAVIKKGEVFKAGEHISFKCIDIGGMTFLLMRLPSGRKLAYPQPKLIPGKFEGTTAVSFYQNIKGPLWGHNSGVWGGVWAENCTQAVAADLMANGCAKAEAKGYETATLIHDEALSYYNEAKGQTVEEFVQCLTDLPDWAAGLPLAAEGGFVPFYRKD